LETFWTFCPNVFLLLLCGIQMLFPWCGFFLGKNKEFKKNFQEAAWP